MLSARLFGYLGIEFSFHVNQLVLSRFQPLGQYPNSLIAVTFVERLCSRVPVGTEQERSVYSTLREQRFGRPKEAGSNSPTGESTSDPEEANIPVIAKRPITHDREAGKDLIEALGVLGDHPVFTSFQQARDAAGMFDMIADVPESVLAHELADRLGVPRQERSEYDVWSVHARTFHPFSSGVTRGTCDLKSSRNGQLSDGRFLQAARTRIERIAQAIPDQVEAQHG